MISEEFENNELKNKLHDLIEALNKGLIEKKETVKIFLLTLLARENLILFGPHGTAKSEISKRISEAIEFGEYFEYLLTKFTKPEEMFGPLSVTELKEDRFYRKTEGYISESHMVFLDEVFNINSGILNLILTLINEKIFYNGDVKEDAPLISLVGTSSVEPSDDLDLQVLYDRFLVRQTATYVNDSNIENLFEISDEEFKIQYHLKIKDYELLEIADGIKTVSIPTKIKEVIKKIKINIKEQFNETNEELISDKKLVKISKLLRTSAYTNGRSEVDLSDILLLQYCLWNKIKNKDVIRAIIIKNIEECYNLINKNNRTSFTNITKTVQAKNNVLKNSYNHDFELKGEGTEYNPFLIEDLSDLVYLGNENLCDKNYYFKQVNDFTITSEWHPIKYFKGTYDGNNKKISNLTNSLFQKIEDSKVFNLTLEDLNINIRSQVDKVGGVAGESINSEINTCSLNGNIIVETSQECFVGGTIGKSINTNLKNCNLKIKVTAVSYRENSYVGGIIGYFQEGSLSKCIIKDSATTSFSPILTYAGGIAGYNSGNIENCLIKGNVSASTSSSYSSNSYSGGIAGYNSGNIKHCSIRVAVTASYSVHSSYSYSYSGGIAGENSGNIEYCLVQIKPSYSYFYSGGITGLMNGEDAKITKCILNGELIAEISNIFTNGIAGKFIQGSFSDNYISNNSTINGNRIIANDENGAMGKTYDYSFFNEKFFRRLGWDFQDTWVWNNVGNIPILKYIYEINDIESMSVNIAKQQEEELQLLEKHPKILSLKELLENNIWL